MGGSSPTVERSPWARRVLGLPAGLTLERRRVQRLHFDLLRAAALVCGVLALLLLALGAGGHDAVLLALGGIASVFALGSAWLWHLGRTAAVGVVVAAALLVAMCLPLVPHELAEPLQATLPALAMMGTLLIDRARARLFLLLLLIAWAAGMALNPWSLHLGDVRGLGGTLVPVAVFLFGTYAVWRGRQELVGAGRRHRDLFERVPVGVKVSSVAGEYLEVNQALADLLGYPDAETLRRAGPYALWKDPAERDTIVDRLVSQGTLSDYETEMVAYDRWPVWVRLSGYYNESDGTMSLLVADMAAERAARHALQEVVEAKDRFIAGISHALRTPLTSVVGFASELADHAGRLDVEDTAEFARLVLQESREVSAVVENLLVAARLESGGVSIRSESVDLAVVARDLAAGLAEPVQVRGTGVATADPRRVRQIVGNLLDNALRHGQGTVTVEVGGNGTGVTTRVIDEGPGVPDEAAADMFKPYWRGRSGSQPESLGLGLSVAHGLARAMSGDLTYRRLGHLTVFELELPAV